MRYWGEVPRTPTPRSTSFGLPTPQGQATRVPSGPLEVACADRVASPRYSPQGSQATNLPQGNPWESCRIGLLRSPMRGCGKASTANTRHTSAVVPRYRKVGAKPMSRASTACSHPRCPNLKPCRDHQRKAWEGSDRHQRLPRGWARLRRTILARDPWCSVCGQSASTEVDHIQAGDNHHITNLQGICTQCHKTKTQAEAQEARAHAPRT